MNSKKSKNKISSELKTLKLPYFKCEQDTAKKNLDGQAMIDLLKVSFPSKYLKYTPAVAAGANGAGAQAEKIEVATADFENFIKADGWVKSYLPILYASNFKYNDLTTLKLLDLDSYISRLTQAVRYIFDMPRLENQLEMIIDSIDQPSKELKLKYYRFMKLQRLKMFNNQTVDFFLSLLHNMYWVSFCEKKENLQTVDFYIDRVIPIVHQLHNSLISELNYEFPIDEIEKNYSKF